MLLTHENSSNLHIIKDNKLKILLFLDEFKDIISNMLSFIYYVFLDLREAPEAVRRIVGRRPTGSWRSESLCQSYLGSCLRVQHRWRATERAQPAVSQVACRTPPPSPAAQAGPRSCRGLLSGKPFNKFTSKMKRTICTSCPVNLCSLLKFRRFCIEKIKIGIIYVPFIFSHCYTLLIICCI